MLARIIKLYPRHHSRKWDDTPAEVVPITPEELRKRLPRQMEIVDHGKRHAEAVKRWGKSFSKREIRRRVRKGLPWRPWRVREFIGMRIEHYPLWIPDAMLLQCDEAKRAGILDKILVADVRVGHRKKPLASGPWILGFLGHHVFVIAESPPGFAAPPPPPAPAS